MTDIDLKSFALVICSRSFPSHSVNDGVIETYNDFHVCTAPMYNSMMDVSIKDEEHTHKVPLARRSASLVYFLFLFFLADQLRDVRDTTFIRTETLVLNDKETFLGQEQHMMGAR